MRSVTERLVGNLVRPVQLYEWWGYQRSVRDAPDTIFVSLQSSGTHWLRTMLAYALVKAYALPDAITDLRQADLIPTFLDKAGRFKYKDRSCIPRIQHSHAPYSLLFRGRRVLMLVRDLRDAMVSHHKVYKQRVDPDISFSDFLRGRGVNRVRVSTLESRIAFLNSWRRYKGRLSDFHVITYEDLKLDTTSILFQVLSYVGISNISDTLLKDTLAFGDIENMRKLEGGNPVKVSSGQIGGYKDVFNDSDVLYFQQMTQELLHDTYGYDYATW